MVDVFILEQRSSQMRLHDGSVVRSFLSETCKRVGTMLYEVTVTPEGGGTPLSAIVLGHKGRHRSPLSGLCIMADAKFTTLLRA